MSKVRSLSPTSSSARALAKAVKQTARKEKQNAAASKKSSDKYKRDEELLLVRLVLENKHIIESKRTDDQTSTAKNECWANITSLFNSRLIYVVSVFVCVSIAFYSKNRFVSLAPR